MAPSSRTVLVAVAGRVLDHLPELVDRIVRLIVAQEPVYQAQGIVPTDVLRRSVAANVGRILKALAGEHLDPDEELSVARTTGRHRAQQSVPLEAVLRAYRLATKIMLDAMLDEARRRPEQELAAFLDVATAIMEIVDRHSEAVVAGYRQTESEMLRRDAQRQQAMFDALLEGRGSDPSLAAEALSVLGLPAEGPYVIAVSTFDIAAHQTLSATRDACAAYSFSAAWRTRADREIGIIALGRSSIPKLVETLRTQTSSRIGISDTFESMHAVPEACRTADIALLTVARGTADVAWIADRLPESLLVSSPDLATRLAARALGPVLALPKAEREVLLETLSIWYDNGRSAARAAAELYCHRNTILNRLRRIESLSGESLEDHGYLLACYLGLLTLSLLPAPPPQASDTPPAAG
jgi:DNA-binding PucR family transcriptional regulator